jgi:AbrB family looped-hinge helix DNA binding protein
MLVVKTLAKGQVVIPIEIRKKFGITIGNLLEVRVVSDHIELYPLPSDPIKALRGSLRGGKSLADGLIAEHSAEVRGEHE